MNVSNYQDGELVYELEKSLGCLSWAMTQDKRLKSTKREILWHRAIALRDYHEMKRRGIPVDRFDMSLANN